MYGKEEVEVNGGGRGRERGHDEARNEAVRIFLGVEDTQPRSVGCCWFGSRRALEN